MSQCYFRGGAMDRMFWNFTDNSTRWVGLICLFNIFLIILKIGQCSAIQRRLIHPQIYRNIQSQPSWKREDVYKLWHVEVLKAYRCILPVWRTNFQQIKLLMTSNQWFEYVQAVACTHSWLLVDLMDNFAFF